MVVMLNSKFFVSVAKSRATANRVASALGASELEKAIDHLQAALVKIKKREEKKAATKQAADLKKLKAMVAKMGLSAADLQKLIDAPPKHKAASKKTTNRKTGPRKRKKVAPKYQLKVGKDTHQWTGRGRMPLVFKAFVENGGSLEECLIK